LVLLLTSLKTFIEQKRESFSEYERQAVEYATERKRKRVCNARLNDLENPNTPEVELTASEEFRVK